MKTEREILDRIKNYWSFYINCAREKPNAIWNTNMLHAMSGSMQNCYDLIWLIETLDKKLPGQGNEE